jgi:DNA-directed RNA polymerase I and III subunit RPAC1
MPPHSHTSGGTFAVTPSSIRWENSTSPTPTPFSIRTLARPSRNELSFELIGVDVSFANALRRIMIAEVPTMALEHIYMWNNTSLIHDEVLCHRLGLVPLNVDPRLFDEFGLEVEEETGEMTSTDRNTIVFRLHVICGRDEKEDDKLRRKMEKKWKMEGLVSGYDVEVEQEKKKKSTKKKSSEDDGEEEEEQDPSVMDVAVADDAAKEALNLHHPNMKKTPIDSANRPFTRHVYTRDLLWAPQGDQLHHFPLQSSGVGSGVGGGIRPITEDILLAKLRPGQVIELEAHARKGVGKDHAKFSPVATASYRLMPQIEIVKPIYDELAEELVNWFEPGVFVLVPVDKAEKKQGYKQKAQVSNPYACTMSRNYMRNPVLKESIKMNRIPNHFIFNVESVGMMEPAVIVAEALKILKEKCEKVVELADGALASMEG